MNSIIYKILIFFIFFINSKNLTVKQISINYDKEANIEKEASKKKVEKEKINIEILVEVLRGAGLNYQDAIKAADTFKKVYPTERLSEQSYLIMPPIGKQINAFAVNIDGVESVLIIKKNESFFAYILSTEQAQKFIADDSEGITNIDSIISIEKKDSFSEEKKTSYEEDIKIFKKGMTLIKFLKKQNINKKLQDKVVKKFSAIHNPYKIKAGSRVHLFKSVYENKLLGFYFTINKKSGVFVHFNNNDLIAEKKRLNDVYKKLSIIIKQDKDYKAPQVIRISLFNNPNLIVIDRKIKKGSNLSDFLKLKQISNLDRNLVINSLAQYLNVNKIKAGQKVKLIFRETNFFGIAIEIDQIKTLELIKSDGAFRAYLFKKPYKKKITFSKIAIKRNFYLDSQDAGLPSEIFQELVKLLSYAIDFQRDIRENTIFEVLYENLYSYKGEYIKSGEIIYSIARFQHKENIQMFKFYIEENKPKYFNEFGESIRKSLMRTPIDGARLSSGFGNRIHPILGYTKMHKGLDFAAKKGTPIYAAGNGKIERASIYGAYGRYIRIKHNSEYKTAYAHLHKFAKGIKKGKYVNQGDIIGYVGSTGRSTGPHLHYEVIYRNKQIDPSKLKLPEGKKLNNKQLELFYVVKKNIFNELEKAKSINNF